MEHHKVGGVPCGFYLLKWFLPEDKQRRHQIGMVLTILLTYVICVAFVSTRIPLLLIEVKVMRECLPTNPKLNGTNWLCERFDFLDDPLFNMASLGTISHFVYAISLHISGCIADYFNPRYYLSMGCLSGGVLSLLFSLSTTWNMKNLEFMFAIIMLQQLSQSTAWPVALSCCTYWYTGSRRGLVFGLWNTHIATGRTLGFALIYSELLYDWGHTFIVPGAFLLIMTIFVYTLLVAHPTDLNQLYQTNQKCAETTGNCGDPSWLNSWKALDYLDAFRVPGVLEFSSCMFFTRMADFSCTFWLPKIEQDLHAWEHQNEETYHPRIRMNLPYVLGGVVGGVASGILKDIYGKGARIIIFFFLVSLPVTALHMLEYTMQRHMRYFLNFVLGALVHGPYILLLASISYDLSRDPIIRRGYRGISTVAAIIESAGAAGAAVTYMANYVISTNNLTRVSVFQIIMLVELVAGLTLVRMAWKETGETHKLKVSLKRYFLHPQWKMRPSST